MSNFNADLNKRRFCSILDDFTIPLSFLNMHFMFPDDTFSYLCPKKDSVSWLDHLICSEPLVTKVKNISVD